MFPKIQDLPKSNFEIPKQFSPSTYIIPKKKYSLDSETTLCIPGCQWRGLMIQHRFKTYPGSFRLKYSLHPRARVTCLQSVPKVFTCSAVELTGKPCFSWGVSHSGPGCPVNPRAGFAAPLPWDKVLPNSLFNEC